MAKTGGIGYFGERVNRFADTDVLEKSDKDWTGSPAYSYTLQLESRHEIKYDSSKAIEIISNSIKNYC